MYDPLTGSWLSPDPLAHKYTSWSPYAYCAGNPVNFVDPDGRRQWPVNRTYKGQPRRIDDGFMTVNRPNHKGIDINLGSGNNDLGAPVYSTHSGKVVRVGRISEDNNPGGNRVRILSPDGSVSTYYMHLSTINVNLGDYVDVGTVIGTIGGSGKGKLNNFSAHLHYELMINLQHINPVLDDANGILVDPQHLNDPVNLGYIESSIVVTDKKLLKLDMNFIKLQPPVRKLRTD